MKPRLPWMTSDRLSALCRMADLLGDPDTLTVLVWWTNQLQQNRSQLDNATVTPAWWSVVRRELLARFPQRWPSVAGAEVADIDTHLRVLGELRSDPWLAAAFTTLVERVRTEHASVGRGVS